MNRLIVTVGGTGQMVLHHYLQLYLLGLIGKGQAEELPFTARVIDTDQVCQSIQLMKLFFERLSYGQDVQQGLEQKIPQIEIPELNVMTTGNAAKLLTGKTNWEAAGMHPAKAFFNRDCLEQDLSQGLFARPALSSVLTANNIAMLGPDRLADYTNVVVVGSVIGGTGGGLTAPTADVIKNLGRMLDRKGIKIYAVFFGPFFRPDKGVLKDDELRFQSNKRLVLLSIKESLKDLHRFVYIEPEEKVQRRTDMEKVGFDMPWPDTISHPYWQGVAALHHFLNDSIADIEPDFLRKEIEISQVQSVINLDEAKTRMNHSLSLLDTFCKQEVVERLATDPWIRQIWGGNLGNIVTRFWNHAASAEGGKTKVKSFYTEVQDEIDNWWYGNKQGLRRIFPKQSDMKMKKITPKDIERVKWPTVMKEAGKRVQESKKGASEVLASSLIFHMLQTRV